MPDKPDYWGHNSIPQRNLRGNLFRKLNQATAISLTMTEEKKHGLASITKKTNTNTVHVHPCTVTEED
ncbi:hypothetical protein BJX76DRAFT_327755 [Aspergillus varians]